MSKPKRFNRSVEAVFRIIESGASIGFFRLIVLAQLAFLSLVAVAPVAVAQQAGVAISGTVTDSTGAAVPGAQIVVKSVQTDIRRSTETNARGQYLVPNLEIGEYQLQVTKQTFQTEIQKGLKLEVGAQPVIDVVLTVGATAETVTVDAGVTSVKTSSTEMSSLVDEREVHELPLNGRNFEQLVLLAPGAQSVGASTANAIYGRNIGYSISGSRPSDQSILLDGQDIQGFWAHGAGNPMTGNSLGVEAIAEYQTITGTYGAQYGGSGSVINAATKAGTNTFHGSAYEFVRNRAFDAANRFDSPLFPTAFSRNQFGGSVGGPIRKNKDFFFANYEGFRQALGTTVINTVPDAAGHQGFVGTTQYAISPAVGPILALYPACSAGLADFPTTSTCQYAAVATTSTNEDYVNVRVDHQISSKDSIFSRYVFDNGTFVNPLASTVVPGWAETDQSGQQFLSIGEVRVFNPKLINVANFGFSRTNSRAATPGGNPLLQFIPGRQNGTIGVTGIAGLGPAASSTPISYVQNKFSFADDATWQRGRHEIKLGITVEREQSNFSFPGSSGGAYTFTGLAGFLQGKPTSYKGLGTSSFLPERGIREIQVFPYVEDTWRVSGRVTLNMGLRYEFVTNPTDNHNLLSAVLNPTTDTGYTHVSNVFISNPSYKNIDPRVGAAWDVFGDHKTAVRAAYGVYHVIIEPREYNNNYSSDAAVITVSQINPTFPSAVGSPSVLSISYGMDYRTNVTAYMTQYSLNVERELAAGTTLTVGYVGTTGHHLPIGQDLNPPVGVLQPNGTYTIANPTVNTNPNFSYIALTRPIASSNYNGLQANLKRSFKRGLDGQIAYTYAHYLDNGSVSGSGFEGQLNGAGFGSNPYSLTPDYGRSSFDVRHNLVGNVLYAFPFRGSKFAEGWQVSSIASLHTGFPFSVRAGVMEGDQNFPLGQERVNLVPGFSNNPLLRQNVIGGVQWYNPAAFSEPAPGTFGNLGRNTLTGPGTVDFDFGTQKTTTFHSFCEACSFQLKADLFNIFNHPNLALPPGAAFSSRSSIVNGNLVQGAVNPLAPIISSTNTTSRQIQLALKFLF